MSSNNKNKMKDKLLNFMFPVGGGSIGAVMTDGLLTSGMLTIVWHAAVGAVTGFLVLKLLGYIWKKLFNKKK